MKNKLIKLCSPPGTEVNWYPVGKQEIILINKAAVYMVPSGMASLIEEKTPCIVKKTKKLKKIAEDMRFIEETDDAAVPANLTGGGKTRKGKDVVKLESYIDRKYIDIRYTEPLGKDIRFFFDDYGWNKDRVYVKEHDKITAMIMMVRENCIIE